MKKILLFSFLFWGATQLPLLHGQTKEAAWKGKVVMEGGVKVVKNPAEPLYGEFSFELQEDLAIGGDPNNEVYYFPKGAGLSVDEEGNLYVCDLGNKRVQMYDRSGKYVRTIGRQGQGPGEYMFPIQVLFGAEGDLYVWAPPQIIIYGHDGTFKKRVVIKAYASPIFVDPERTVFAAKHPFLEPGGPKHSIVQLDVDGSVDRTIAEFRGELAEDQKVIVSHWYCNGTVSSPVTDELFCYGFSGEYKIYVADSEGRTTLIITKDEKPHAISGKEKDETRKSGVSAWSGSTQKPEDDIVFPDHRPFFGTILNDDAGCFYVVRFNSILEKDAPSSVDVFSNKGIYLYKMTWPFIPAAIKHACLYEVRSDNETGEVRIVRHRIKNWSRMATGRG
jgi:hypothetical protein